MNAQQTLAPDGSFLPSTLARLKAENSYILHDVARDLGELVSGITTLEIEEDASRNRYVMYATPRMGAGSPRASSLTAHCACWR